MPAPNGFRSAVPSPLRRAGRRLAAATRPSPRRQALGILRPRLAFLVGEARGGTRAYRVGATRVLLRHGSRDVDIVNEIWGPDPSYEPPAALTARLAGRGLRVLDLGGNIGLFGAFAFARWDLAALTSYEPDPANLALLGRVRELNALAERWTVHACAVSNFSGEIEFMSLGSPESYRAEPGQSGTRVRAGDLFAAVPEQPVDLLKIDIEGGEWALLLDPRLADFPAQIIVIEWHWRGAPGPDAHAAAVDALTAAGYRIDSDEPGQVPGIGVIWASRPLADG